MTKPEGTTASLGEEQTYQLALARDAKQWRDEHPEYADATADAVLAYYEAGVFEIPAGHDPKSQDPADYLAAHPQLTRRDTLDAGDEFNGRRGGEPASNQFGTFAVHEASDKQVAFLKRLIASKDYSAKPEIKIPATVDGISKKSASALIDRLLGCPDRTSSGPGTTTARSDLATDNQMAFLRRLIGERDYFSLLPADRAKVDLLRDSPDARPTKRGASALIEVLKATAVNPHAAPAATAPSTAGLAGVPEGRYALESTGDGVKFVQVDRPTEGKWAGWLFVSYLSGAPGDWNQYPVKDRAAKAALLARITDAGVEASARLFGLKTQTCGFCSSALSLHQSRAAGYGAHCAGKHGLYYPSKSEALRILNERGESIEDEG